MATSKKEQREKLQEAVEEAREAARRDPTGPNMDHYRDAVEARDRFDGLVS